MGRLNYHDPDDILDYKNDWTEWLVAGDTITASSWSISPDTATIDSDEETDTETVAWVSGGVAGTRYELTNSITTAGGRQKDVTRYLVCREE